MTDTTRGAHRYDPDPRDTTSVPTCWCGMTRRYRDHQSWWWRLLNPHKGWR